ncbi:Oxidoreductase N-terminal, partial [Trinorchestia longiramus]
AGSIHLINVLQTPRLRLLYIVDGQTTRLDVARRNFCLPDSVCLIADTEAQTVFSDDRVDAVIVATPTLQHHALVVEALGAHKHVLCEKPIAHDLALVRSCYNLARKNKRALLCAFHRRFDPAFATIFSDIREGLIGDLRSLSSVSRDCPKPSLQYLKHSCGIFHDTLVHDLDMMCEAVGEYPVEVMVVTHCFCPHLALLGDYDTVVAVLKFPGGQLGTIDVSRESSYGYDQRFEVFGSKGMLRADNQKPTSLARYTGGGSSSDSILFSFPSRYAEAYLRETEHFLDVLDGTSEVLVTEDNVVKVTNIVAAIEESVKTKAFVTVQY